MIKLEDNKYKFETDSDLTAYSYMKAEEWIREQLNPDYTDKMYFTLSVPSQLMSEAVKYAFCLPLSDVQINFEYEADEWSVTGYYYDKDFNKTELTVWSPGV